MRGINDDATFLANHLIQFAKNQSIIVAHESQVDQQKIAAMSSMNQMQQPTASISPADSVNFITSTVKSTCAQCLSSLSIGAKFCGNCGTKVT